jgi:hypothetical protein
MLVHKVEREIMLLKSNFIRFIIFLFWLFGAHSVTAHRPLWGDENGVTEIPNLQTSYAYYRQLSNDQPFHTFIFEGNSDQTLYAGVNIPAISGLETYEVTVALVGPGLPKEGREQLPLEPPEDAGVLIFPSEMGEDFFEPFTQTRDWGRQEVAVPLPRDDEYYLVVWNEQDEDGKYVLDTGRREEFSPGDIFRFPIWWLQVHLFFEHGFYILAGALTIILGFGLIIFWIRRKTA